MEWIMLFLLGAQGYFTIFRLTPGTNNIISSVLSQGKDLMNLSESSKDSFNLVTRLLASLADLNTELKLRKADTSRLIEWLDKRDKELLALSEKIDKNLHIEEREKRLDHHQSEIIQLGKEIRLIREKK